MNRNIPDDLLWTAYQYAVGELPGPAAREFESRLEQEQPVREALAEAVAWQETVRAAEELAPALFAQGSSRLNSTDRDVAPVVTAPFVTSASLQRGWRTAACWVALGAAACLALVFVIERMRSGAGRPVEIAAAQIEDDARLLAALTSDYIAEDVSPLVAPLLADAVPVDHEENFDVHEGAELDVAAPDWLLAAVAESSEFGGND